MKPEIERIETCDTDPHKSATHLCRTTGAVLSADQIDTYALMYDVDGQSLIKGHLKDVFMKLAIEVAEDLVRALLGKVMSARADAPPDDAPQAVHYVAPHQLAALAGAFENAIEHHISNAEEILLSPQNTGDSQS